jgi:hypothetical protein
VRSSRWSLCWLVALALPGLAAPAAAAPAPDGRAVSDEQGLTYWSPVARSVDVRVRPGRGSPKSGRLGRFTYYGNPDLALVLGRSGDWTRVRYSGLGSRTGWVPDSALSPPHLTRTWVFVDRGGKLLRAYRGDRLLLRAPIGVGARGSATPGGRFFIRERLVPRDKNSIYGALAFGLSAYSRHRTDWPGGGQVGIHGTNEPGLIPGRISNGCVRLRNRDVVRLGRIVERGTPVQII